MQKISNEVVHVFWLGKCFFRFCLLTIFLHLYEVWAAAQVDFFDHFRRVLKVRYTDKILHCQFNSPHSRRLNRKVMNSSTTNTLSSFRRALVWMDYVYKKIEKRIKTSQYFTVQRMTFRLYDFIVYVHMARLAISAMCRKKLRLVFLSWEGRKMFYWIFLLLLHRIPREVCRCATQFFNQISTRCSKKACCYGHRWRVKCGPKRIYASNGQQFTAVKYTGRLASVHQFSPSLGHWFKFHFTA